MSSGYERRRNEPVTLTLAAETVERLAAGETVELQADGASAVLPDRYRIEVRDDE